MNRYRASCYAMNQKGFAPILILVGIALVIAGGVYYFVKPQVPNSQSQNSSVTSQTLQFNSITKPSPTPEKVDGWRTYTLFLSAYSINYPLNYSQIGRTSLGPYDFNNAFKKEDFISNNNFISHDTPNYNDFTPGTTVSSISVFRANGKNVQQTLSYLKNVVQDIEEQPSKHNGKLSKIDGSDTVIFTANANSLTNALTIHNDKIYIFTYLIQGRQDPGLDSTGLSIYYQMLSSFKFLSLSKEATPENIVFNYYHGYISCLQKHFLDVDIGASAGKSPKEDCPDQNLNTTPDFQKNLSTQNISLLCHAQDVPESITVDKAIINNDTALTTVHTSFIDGFQFKVQSRMLDGQWKINNLICPSL